MTAEVTSAATKRRSSGMALDFAGGIVGMRRLPRYVVVEAGQCYENQGGSRPAETKPLSVHRVKAGTGVRRR
jgi:hypothetical protein